MKNRFFLLLKEVIRKINAMITIRAANEIVLLFKSSLLIVLVCAVYRGESQSLGQYKILTKKDGLSNDYIQCMYEDHRGFLWLGSRYGLNRFDGNHFKAFVPSEESGLKGSSVHVITPLDSNHLLLGTSLGMSVFDLREESFHSIMFEGKNHELVHNNLIINIIHLSSGSICVQTPMAIHLMNPKFELQTTLRLPERIDLSLLMQIDSITLIAKGRTSKGQMVWYKLNLRSRQLQILDFEKIFDVRGDQFNKLNDSILIVQNKVERKIYLLNIGNSTKSQINLHPKNEITWLMAFPVSPTEFFINMDGSYFVGNQNSKELHPIKPVHENEANVWINQFYRTGSGALYAATSSGLFKYSNDLEGAIHQLPKLGQQHQLHPGVSVNDFLRRDGKLMIATYGDGIWIYDSLTQAVTKIWLDNIVHIWNLRSHTQDTIWVGTQIGLFWLNAKNNKYGRLNHSNKPTAMDSVPITFQFLDSRGLLWIGLSRANGIARYNFTENKFKNYNPYVKGGSMMKSPKVITEDPDGNLWFGSQHREGLMKWDRELDSFSVIHTSLESGFSNDIFECIASDKDGIIWCGCHGSGLVAYDPESKKFSNWTTNNSLSSNFVWRLSVTENNLLWIGTQDGLNLFDQSRSRITQFDQSHGLPHANISCLKGWDDKMFIGTQEGFVIWPVPPDLESQPDQIWMTGLRIKDKPVVRTPGQSLKLTYDENYLNLEFSLPDLKAGQRNSYLYRISGEDIWHNLENSNQVTLAGLKPGRYSIDLQVCQTGNNCIFKMKALQFRIKPPFWRSSWFITLVVAGLGGLWYIVYKLRINQLKRIQSVRNKIAADLHDDLGASLSSIRIMAGIAARSDLNVSSQKGYLQHIVEEATQMGHTINDIIWSILPQNDKLDQVMAKITRYASELLEAKGISYDIRMDDQLNQVRISLEKRRDLYLFTKEAINNLVKHADCQNAEISLRKENHDILLTIIDDGTGFDPEVAYASNGIRTMQLRARQLHGRLTINSHNLGKKGTHIGLEFPITT